MEQLTSTSPEMVAQELDMAMLAYHLVRAVAYIAAQTAGRSPRPSSFTRVRNVIHAFAPLIANAKDEQQVRKLWDDILDYNGHAQLLKRTHPRPLLSQVLGDN